MRCEGLASARVSAGKRIHYDAAFETVERISSVPGKAFTTSTTIQKAGFLNRNPDLKLKERSLDGRLCRLILEIMSRLPPDRGHNEVSDFQCRVRCRLWHEIAFRWDMLTTPVNLEILKGLFDELVGPLGRLKKHFYFFAQSPLHNFTDPFLEDGEP